jgi:hypothetical protein
LYTLSEDFAPDGLEAIKLGGLLAEGKAVVKTIVPGEFDIARGTGGSGIASYRFDACLAPPSAGFFVLVDATRRWQVFGFIQRQGESLVADIILGQPTSS